MPDVTFAEWNMHSNHSFAWFGHDDYPYGQGMLDTLQGSGMTITRCGQGIFELWHGQDMLELFFLEARQVWAH